MRFDDRRAKAKSMTPPTLSDLRTTEATLRALGEATADDARASFLMLAAMDVAQRVREREAELMVEHQRQQWVRHQRLELRTRRGH